MKLSGAVAAVSGLGISLAPTSARAKELKIKYGKKTVKIEYREQGLLKSAEFPMEQISSDAFHKLLVEKDIETIHSGETTLEEIFIKVTGVALHE